MTTNTNNTTNTRHALADKQTPSRAGTNQPTNLHRQNTPTRARPHM